MVTAKVPWVCSDVRCNGWQAAALFAGTQYAEPREISRWLNAWMFQVEGDNEIYALRQSSGGEWRVVVAGDVDG